MGTKCVSHFGHISDGTETMTRSDERALLLPASRAEVASAQRRWSAALLPRAAVVALLVLGIATSLALVRVAQLSEELLRNLQQLHPVAASHTASLYTTAASRQATATSAATRAVSAAPARVLIVYSNGTHLSKLAAAVERGVRESVASPDQLRTRLVEEASFKDDVMWADAVILGSHVVNANVEPKMAAFLSGWVFSEDLSHKVGAAFVTGGGLSAGEELTMVNLLHSMLIFRMVIVGGERWTSAFGASAIVSEGPFQPLSGQHRDFPSSCYPQSPDDLHDMFKDKAEGLGRRVASVASLLVSASTNTATP